MKKKNYYIIKNERKYDEMLCEKKILPNLQAQVHQTTNHLIDRHLFQTGIHPTKENTRKTFCNFNQNKI